jgi:hypothetical protein
VDQCDVVIAGDDIPECRKPCTPHHKETSHMLSMPSSHVRRYVGSPLRPAGHYEYAAFPGLSPCWVTADHSCCLWKRVRIRIPAAAGHVLRTDTQPPNDTRPCDRSVDDWYRICEFAFEDAVEVFGSSDGCQRVLVCQNAEHSDLVTVLKTAASSHVFALDKVGLFPLSAYRTTAVGSVEVFRPE